MYFSDKSTFDWDLTFLKLSLKIELISMIIVNGITIHQFRNHATSFYLVILSVESRPDELRGLCRGQGNRQKGDRVHETHL